MKTSFLSVLGTVLALATASALTASAQSTPVRHHVSSSASAGVHVVNSNGQAVVTFNGQQVYAGPVKGHVSSVSHNNNGVEYAAAFDGDTLLWENVPGAASQLKAAPGAPTGLDQQQLLQQHRETVERMKEEQRQFMAAHGGTNFHHSAGTNFSTGGASSHGQSSGGIHTHTESHSSSQSGNTSVSVKTVNGSTVITYQGHEFSVGPTQGQISTKTKSVNGTTFAAVFEGDRVIWENIPGAAQQVK